MLVHQTGVLPVELAYPIDPQLQELKLTMTATWDYAKKNFVTNCHDRVTTESRNLYGAYTTAPLRPDSQLPGPRRGSTVTT